MGGVPARSRRGPKGPIDALTRPIDALTSAIDTVKLPKLQVFLRSVPRHGTPSRASASKFAGVDRCPSASIGLVSASIGLVSASIGLLSASIGPE
ncbi:MAG: hypothetical protein Q8Q09_06555 [Deltaproteobacteria bacterium]|nr:hypothetical protein [Deltaproteobacteria bacterium]